MGAEPNRSALHGWRVLHSIPLSDHVRPRGRSEVDPWEDGRPRSSPEKVLHQVVVARVSSANLPGVGFLVGRAGIVRVKALRAHRDPFTQFQELTCPLVRVQKSSLSLGQLGEDPPLSVSQVGVGRHCHHALPARRRNQPQELSHRAGSHLSSVPPVGR